MGQKVHPRSIRLGIVKDWDCNWFADASYPALVLEDLAIRKFLKDEFQRAGVARIIINRKAQVTEAIVYVARPGILFPKSGNNDLSLVQEALNKKHGCSVRITIIEQPNPEANAKLIADWIVAQLEKRVAFRRAMKMAMQKALKSGALGIKCLCSGRLGGVEIARREGYREGKVPLHTLRADIDYAFSEALTTYGKIGVKVWVYNGEILPGMAEAGITEEKPVLVIQDDLN